MRESLINDELSSYRVMFTREKTFDDLIGEKGKKLRFDFALYDTNHNVIALIEHQGQQHYSPRWRDDFGKHQREVTDQMKRDYCTAHNIPLREIRYDDDIPSSVRNIL